MKYALVSFTIKNYTYNINVYGMVEPPTLHCFLHAIDPVQADEFTKLGAYTLYTPMNAAKNMKWALTMHPWLQYYLRQKIMQQSIATGHRSLKGLCLYNVFLRSSRKACPAFYVWTNGKATTAVLVPPVVVSQKQLKSQVSHSSTPKVAISSFFG